MIEHPDDPIHGLLVAAIISAVAYAALLAIALLVTTLPEMLR